VKELDGKREDAVIDFAGLRLRLSRIARRLALETTYDFSETIARANLSEMQSILKIDIEKEPVKIRRLLERWRAENVELIESIATRLHGDVRDLVRDVTRTGARVESVTRRIAERYDVSAARANLIARDQVLKANADLTRARAQEAGIERYRWSTSKDERVRGKPGGRWPKGLHHSLDGKIFAWTDPPIANLNGERSHPGRDFGCRCVAVLILGE
jgi:SPP1 gp7 family putative phage head morphogenesis protein